MPAFTYDALVDQLESYLDRPGDQEFIDQIPNFIEQGQIALSRDAKFLGFLVVLAGTFQTGVWVIDKPDRWRETVWWKVGSGTNYDDWNTVYPRTYSYVRDYVKNPVTNTGLPKYYADYDANHWLVGKTPADDYPFQVGVYMTPAILDSSNQTNWLTQYAPDILLYTALLQASPYLKNDARIPVWQTLYKEKVASQALECSRLIVDQSQMVESS